MHDHSLFESYVLDHFSTDRHNKVVQTTSTKIFWDFEGLGSTNVVATLAPITFSPDTSTLTRHNDKGMRGCEQSASACIQMEGVIDQ